jgi:hypothetical protein
MLHIWIRRTIFVIGSVVILMETHRKIGSYRFTDALKGILSILLLSVYCLGNLNTQDLHFRFHSPDKSNLHTEEAEKDRCHIAVFHREGSGCKHNLHLTKIEKCNLCHLIIHNEHLGVSDQGVHILKRTPSIQGTWVFSELHVQVSLLSSRGPPQA